MSRLGAATTRNTSSGAPRPGPIGIRCRRRSLHRRRRVASHCRARCVWGVRSRRSSGCLRRAVPALRYCCWPPPLRWSCCRAAPALGWLTAALAPALGAVGLAGAFPALAGQRARLAERAALGALGYWWLILAEPLLDRRLWLGVPAGTPARAVWEGSLSSAATHVVGPSLGLGVLYGAAVWALAAVLLPWVVRGRSAVLDVVAASAWSVALLLACAPHYAGYRCLSCPRLRAAQSSARSSAAHSRWPRARCAAPSEDGFRTRSAPQFPRHRTLPSRWVLKVGSVGPRTNPVHPCDEPAEEP